ncbi:MAG: hypothetical protein AAF483_02515 [Planctomycetota bacterium]
MPKQFQVDEKVVYLHDRYSNQPPPKSKNVFATKKGEQYLFQVEKYWIISRILASNQIEARNRNGSTYVIDCDDPRLRKATWWELLFKSNAFPPPGTDHPKV